MRRASRTYIWRAQWPLAQQAIGPRGQTSEQSRTRVGLGIGTHDVHRGSAHLVHDQPDEGEQNAVADQQQPGQTLIRQGLVRIATALRMGLSTHTVGDYCKSLYRRLNLFVIARNTCDEAGAPGLL